MFVTRADSGRAQFNYSEVFGASTAAAISTYTYHPRSAYIRIPSNPHMFVASERTFSNVVSTWATQVGLDTITLVVKEFWPDIHRKKPVACKKSTGRTSFRLLVKMARSGVYAAAPLSLTGTSGIR